MRFASSFRYILPGLLAVFLISGCDSFVDKSPISSPNADNFFNTRSDFETALNGAYDALQQEGTFNRNYWILFEMRSDNTDQGQDVTGLAARLAEINEFSETTTSEILQAAWVQSYDGIERTNVILDRLEDLEAEQSFKDRIRGEALFLRSLLYYHLAVAYGNIPMKLEATTGPDDAASVTDQVSAQEVFSQIEGDLSTAQDLLSPGSPARANSGAANALLGKVRLAMGDQSGAETALRRVTGNYSLLDDYGDLWGPDRTENSAESIFEIQFTAGGVGEGSRFTNTFSPSGDLQTGEGLGENRPTESMVDAYFDTGSERFQSSMDTTYVNDEGDTVNARYITKFESDPFSNFDAENNWIVLRHADVLLMLAEAVGESPEGWDLIDQVRDRSLPDPQYDVDRSGDFYEQLLQERRVELAFENHRWPDLKRFQAQYDIQARDFIEQEVDALSGFNLLFPIPQRAVDVAELDQNDGYDD